MTTIPHRPALLVVFLGLAVLQVLAVGIGTSAALQEPSTTAPYPPVQETCDEYRSIRADPQAVEALFGPAEGDRVQVAEDCLLQEMLVTPEADLVSVSVAMDQDANLVCAQIQRVGSVGSACTDADAQEPMVVTSTVGDRSDSPLTVVVVDPQRRLSLVQTLEAGALVQEFGEVMDEGLWMTVELPPPPYPEEVVLLDAQGQVLITLRLNDDLAASQAEIEKAKQVPIEVEH